jgi:2-iminobutanoate/2-iminopropanoate deaminase
VGRLVVLEGPVRGREKSSPNEDLTYGSTDVEWAAAMSDSRRFLADLPASAGKRPFSRAVAANGLVWASGIGAEDLVSGAMRETIEEQTADALRNLRRVLESAGSGWERIVWIQVGLAAAQDYARMNAEYVKHFPPDALPARATVQLGFQDGRTRVVFACTALAGP